jgi:hypothetical protein
MMTYDFRFKTNDAISRHLQTKHGCAFLRILAGDRGLEPRNAGIKIQCLNQLGESPTQVSRFAATNR